MSRGKNNSTTRKAAPRSKVIDVHNSLESYLSQIAAFKMSLRADYKYSNLESLVYENGIRFEKSKAADEMGEMGQCFMNAGKLAMDNPGFEYCEGYAYTPTCPIPVLHAWCVDSDNVAVDPTWSDAKECAYMGIIIPKPALHRTLLSRQKWGILDNPEERFPYLKLGIDAHKE